MRKTQENDIHHKLSFTVISFLKKINQFFQKKPKSVRYLIKIIVEWEKKKVIDYNIRKMLEGVISISQKRVRDIMTPRSHIITLRNNQNLKECLEKIVNYPYSRFPVINKNKDQIEGLLVVKDLLPFLTQNEIENFQVSAIMRKAMVTPESKIISVLLREFQIKKQNIAIVIDEFGGVSGLVTMENILNSIVGYTSDKYKNFSDNINIRKISESLYLVNALTQIDEFNKTFHSHLKSQEFETIGGLIMQSFGRLPSKGESIIIDSYKFKIVLADSRKIIQTEVKIPKSS
ncbi:HlyC/CorC family transporter [Candidatus Riesia pediculicola]|uniref:HlyC/CorC family transporter n=1 Tax=Candidatus Riesia pediculicola TaxID=401619 RepID=UPI0009C3C4E9|nr:transporter associated domain-containing protein [Candidatus Riesia pediculicola]ARC54084.1 magnesium/cobalt efflux protein CorC [Candidatus Riesia pediculicola]